MFPGAGSLFAFIVTVWGKAFFQELVGQYTGLGEAPNRTSHFQVNVSIVHLVGKVILLGNPRGEGRTGCACICIDLGGPKGRSFYIEANIFGIGCAEYTVPV